MNKRLATVREKIRKTRRKIEEEEEYLEVLLKEEKQLENKEIIARFRAMNGKNGDVMEILDLVMGESSKTEEKQKEEVIELYEDHETS